MVFVIISSLHNTHHASRITHHVSCITNRLLYNDVMEVDAVRIACPACGSRLTVLPRIQYLACRHCGSEYLVQRRGNTVGLEAFAEEQYEISKQIAAVERTQTEGCSNVFFWIFAVAGIFFCLLGFLGRTFLNSNIPLLAGWALSLLALIVAAGVLIKMLNGQRDERVKLEVRQQELYEQRGEEGEEARPASKDAGYIYKARLRGLVDRWVDSGMKEYGSAFEGRLRLGSTRIHPPCQNGSASPR